MDPYAAASESKVYAVVERGDSWVTMRALSRSDQGRCGHAYPILVPGLIVNVQRSMVVEWLDTLDECDERPPAAAPEVPEPPSGSTMGVAPELPGPGERAPEEPSSVRAAGLVAVLAAAEEGDPDWAPSPAATIRSGAKLFWLSGAPAGHAEEEIQTYGGVAPHLSNPNLECWVVELDSAIVWDGRYEPHGKLALCAHTQDITEAPLPQMDQRVLQRWSSRDRGLEYGPTGPHLGFGGSAGG